MKNKVHVRKKTRSNIRWSAPCGERSRWYCWKYRYKDPLCRDCKLYVVKGRKHKVLIDDKGQKVIKCHVCGKVKPVSDFAVDARVWYDQYGTPKHYAYYSYRCKQCTIEAACESRKRKLEKKNEKNTEQ